MTDEKTVETEPTVKKAVILDEEQTAALEKMKVFKVREITSESEMDVANRALSRIGGFIKAVEKRRGNLTKPLNDEKQGIIDEAKEILVTPKKIEADIKTAMGTWGLKEKRRKEEEAAAAQKLIDDENARLQAEADEKAETERKRIAAETNQDLNDVEVEVPKVANVATYVVPKTVAPVKDESGTTSMGFGWVGEVVDEAKVPDEYTIRTIDMKKIQEAIDAGERNIPGVKIEEKANVTNRSRVGRNLG